MVAVEINNLLGNIVHHDKKPKALIKGWCKD